MKSVTINGKTYSFPYADLLPPLRPEERQALAENIRRRGVLVDVVVTEDYEVLDGHNRLEIAAELGLAHVPIEVMTGLSGEQKRQLALDLNLHRRHLSREEIREVIERSLRADPGQSDRAIADTLKVDHKTVGVARKRLEAGGEIPHLGSTKGKDGKKQPRKKKERDKPVQVIVKGPPAAETPALPAPDPEPAQHQGEPADHGDRGELFPETAPAGVPAGEDAPAADAGPVAEEQPAAAGPTPSPPRPMKNWRRELEHLGTILRGRGDAAKKLSTLRPAERSPERARKLFLGAHDQIVQSEVALLGDSPEPGMWVSGCCDALIALQTIVYVLQDCHATDVTKYLIQQAEAAISKLLRLPSVKPAAGPAPGEAEGGSA
jgi:hypothetical protein